MRKHNAENERMKREYLLWLKNPRAVARRPSISRQPL